MRIFVGKAYVGVTGSGRSLDMQDWNLKEENCFENKNITKLDIVQQHCCENFVEFGCQGIV